MIDSHDGAFRIVMVLCVLGLLAFLAVVFWCIHFLLTTLSTTQLTVIFVALIVYNIARLLKKCECGRS